MVVDLIPWLIMSALGAFRLSELVALDDGPFDILNTLRGWAFSNNVLKKTIAGAMNCVHCAGLWISFGFGLIYYFYNHASWLESLLFAFAVAGLQSILASRLGRKS